jgi:hypothetical protein
MTKSGTLVVNQAAVDADLCERGHAESSSSGAISLDDDICIIHIFAR